MIDREKVIKGLECCADECVYGCPYDHFGDEGLDCTALLCRDAVELLKAQEPRVLSLEEVAGMVALERETIIYMEYGHNSTHAGKVRALIPKYMYFDDENGLSWLICEGPEKGKKDSVSLFEYNDVWRCWTSRPTDEQREAVKWE
jgi:hypothetical protein